MFAGLVISVVVAFLWPDTFISTAVMRITPQQVPTTLVPSVINSQMTERLNQMEQEILSRSSLQELIQRPSLDLYKKERLTKPMEDIIQDMRNKYVKIQMLDVPGGVTGGVGGKVPASAFVIQFQYPDKYKAQAVVRELVTKFTEQNVTVQRNQASLTTSFLNDELKNAKERLSTLDAEITKFRMENQGRLPEQAAANSQALLNLQMQLGAVGESISRDQQDKMMLETRLQTLRHDQDYYAQNLEDLIPGGGPISVKNQHLINLENEITQMKSRLAALRHMYKDNHPDVQNTQAQINALEEEKARAEKENSAQQVAPTAPRKVTNPQSARALQSLKDDQATTQTAIQAKQQEIEAKTRREAELNRQIMAIQSRIEASPQLEQQYGSLQRDYALAQQEYQEMSRRKEASETAQNLEEHKAGENLEVLDPANLPDAPAEPNRLVWAGIGTVAGLMLGVVLAAAKEMKNTSLKNLKDVRAYTNLPVLSSIPLLENALLVRRKRRLFWLAWSSAIIIGSIAMSGSMYYYYFGHS
jgi:uncharacterized protein involved in exopolysaccharide biosynthesis